MIHVRAEVAKSTRNAVANRDGGFIWENAYAAVV